MYVSKSIVKFNDDQSKSGLISLMKKSVKDDHGQNIKVRDVQLSPLQWIKISFGCCPCKLYVEQSLLIFIF